MKRLLPLLALSLALLASGPARAEDGGATPKVPEVQDTSAWDEDWQTRWDWANSGSTVPKPISSCVKGLCRSCTPNLILDKDECQWVGRNGSCACAPFTDRTGRNTCRLEGICTSVQST